MQNVPHTCQEGPEESTTGNMGLSFCHKLLITPSAPRYQSPPSCASKVPFLSLPRGTRTNKKPEHSYQKLSLLNAKSPHLKLLNYILKQFRLLTPTLPYSECLSELHFSDGEKSLSPFQSKHIHDQLIIVWHFTKWLFNLHRSFLPPWLCSFMPCMYLDTVNQMPLSTLMLLG